MECLIRFSRQILLVYSRYQTYLQVWRLQTTFLLCISLVLTTRVYFLVNLTGTSGGYVTPGSGPGCR